MSAVSIGEFAKKLAMQDRIFGDWKNFVDGTLRKNGATKVPGWDIPGSNTAAGNNNNATFDPNASNLDPKQVTEHFINLGREAVKKWGLGDNQDDTRLMVAYGAAEQAARNALNNSGYNIDARNAFHNAFKLMGYEIKKPTRANGSYFIPYDDRALREADLERVNAEITNASVSGDSKRVAELKKKKAEIEAWGNVKVSVTRAPMSSEPPFMRYGGGVLGLGDNGISNGLRNMHNNNEQPHYTSRMVRLAELQNAPQLSQNPLLQGGELRLQPHRQSDAQISAPRPRVRRKSK
jgi:hypothetical protein